MRSTLLCSLVLLLGTGATTHSAAIARVSESDTTPDDQSGRSTAAAPELLLAPGAFPGPLPAANREPTESGALENSRVFKAAVRKALAEVASGLLPQESGFMVLPDGRVSPVQLGPEIKSNDEKGITVFHVPREGVFATLHVHPRPTTGHAWIQVPSPGDVAAAVTFGINVYVVTSSGLWLVEPDGHVSHVFADHNWMKDSRKP